MSEEKEEGPITTGELDKPLEEGVATPISLDLTKNQISMSEVPLQKHKKKSLKRWSKHKRNLELVKGNRRGE